MSRKTARELALRLLFEVNFSDKSYETVMAERLTPELFASLSEEDKLYAKTPNEGDTAFIRRIMQGVSEHMPELDGYIERYSVGWKFGRISQMAVGIMRLAMFEILYMPDVPNSSSIDEAVEFAKRYDSPESAAFINGILGTFERTERVE